MAPDVFRFARRRSASDALALTIALMFASAASASVIHVDDDAPSGGDGTSWPTAFNDLQDALAIAQEGDEIRVAQGIYKPAPPNGPRTATFYLVNGTTLRGGYAGIGASDPNENDPKKFETILSGDLNGDDGPNFMNNGDNTHVIVTALDFTSQFTGLMGFVITGANSDGAGGGLRCVGNASPQITQVVFVRNFATTGAGVFAEAGSLELTECSFIENRIPAGSMGAAGASVGGPAKFVRCHFEKNYAPSNQYAGGTGGLVGGQSFLFNCSFIENHGNLGGGLRGGVLIVGSDFHKNTASSSEGDGGGAYSGATFINCRFTKNAAYRGGAVHSSTSTSPVFVNCLFAGNYSNSHGAAASVYTGMFQNCTVVGNTSAYGGALHQPNSPGTLQIVNSVLWRNGRGEDNQQDQIAQLHLPSGNSDIKNSCIQGWTGSLGGTGNHGNDPRFIDADGPDDIYGTEDDNPRLLPNSPLIDRGDTSALPPDTFDLDEDGDTTEPIPLDLDWLPRIVNGTVDVGAYEFQGTPCLADITGDGTVNVQDLLAVLDNWGQCQSGQPCNADLTLDAAVSLDDFLFVINNWGACQ